VAPGVVDFAAHSKWKFPADPGTLVGRKYHVPVCMIYQIDANGIFPVFTSTRMSRAWWSQSS